MKRVTTFGIGPTLVTAIGLVLFVLALGFHISEAMRIDQIQGPLIAFAVDGAPALLLVAGGYYLSTKSFSAENNWRVVLGTVAGGSIVTGIIGLGILVRVQEGRVVSETPFQLLVGATAGSVAGFAAGYFYAASMERAARARETMGTLSFTNSVLRHDIKNDMTVVRGRAQVILETEPDQEIVEVSARTIDRQVDEVLDVIDSTSSIAETLSDDPDYDPVDVAAVARTVAETYADAYSATVTVDAPDRAEVVGNDAIRTVISNLVENGIEHNDADEPAVDITVETEPDTVRVHVLDNGPGIPDAEKADLFEPRSDDVGGGGLHVVSTLVENFGGELRVEDNEPRGGTFIATFPRAQAS